MENINNFKRHNSDFIGLPHSKPKPFILRRLFNFLSSNWFNYSILINLGFIQTGTTVLGQKHEFTSLAT